MHIGFARAPPPPPPPPPPTGMPPIAPPDIPRVPPPPVPPSLANRSPIATPPVPPAPPSLGGLSSNNASTTENMKQSASDQINASKKIEGNHNFFVVFNLIINFIRDVQNINKELVYVIFAL